MPRNALSLAGLSFTVSAGLVWLTSGCLAGVVCDCGPAPLEPIPEGPFSIDEASMENPDEPLIVDPIGETLTIERARVTVSYERLGKKH